MFHNYLLTAFRNILRHKYFSVIIIAGLTLGIAVFGLIFTYVKHELSFDRFNEHYKSTYRLEMPDWALTGTAYGPELSNEFPEIIAGSRVSSWEGGNVTIRIDDRLLTLSNLIYADSGFFDIFSIRFIKGNPDKGLDVTNSVILTESTARKLFGYEDPINKTFLLGNKVVLTVTGVIKDISQFHLKVNAIAPFRTLKLFYENTDFLNQYGSWNYYTYFRLQENADPQILTSKINGFYKGRIFWQEHTPEFSLRPLSEIYYTQVKNDFGMTKANKPMLFIYMLVAVFILLIACVNFINLAVAKAATRSKEIGVRKITGAGKRNLITQFLGESIIYAFLATLLALFLMQAFRPVFNNLVQRDLSLLTLGWGWLVALILLLPVVIGIVAGLYPAWYLTHLNAIVTIKGIKTRGKESLLFRRMLIVVQFTISIVLIIATFTVYRQLNYFRDKNVGYNKENIIQLNMNSSLNGHRDAFKDMLLANSSIKGISFSTQSLDNVSWQESIEVNQESKQYTYIGSDHEFIPLMGLEMADGRSFRYDTPSDSGKVIINEQAVSFFGLQYPATGKIIGTGEQRFEVLGVIRDFHYRSLHSPIGPLVIGLRKNWLSTANIRVDNRNLSESIQYIQSVWNKLSPDFLFEYSFLDERYENLYNNERRLGKTFVYLAVLAIFIACIGLLGLSAFIAQLKMKEIGIRKTLGDTTGGIVMRTSREFFILVGVSGLIAIPLSFMLLKKWLNTFAYHVQQDAFIMVVACLIALVVALVTVYLQIGRIANSDPVDALRYE